MNKNIIDYEEIRDAHLDNLIRLAYKRAELEEIHKLAEDDGKTLPEELNEVSVTAFANFQKKRRKAEREEKCIIHSAHLRRSLPKAINVAAVIAILACATVPIAVAKVDPIRDKVMEILVKYEKEYADVGIVRYSEAALRVPEEWSGKYFPTYIPEGYEIEEKGAFLTRVMFRNKEGKEISFREYTECERSNIDNENAEGATVEINGAEGYITEKDGIIVLVWNNGDRFFVLSADEPRAIVIRIAEQISLIPN